MKFNPPLALIGAASLTGLIAYACARGTLVPQRLGAHAAEQNVPDAALDSSPFLFENSHPPMASGEKGPGVPDFWVRPGFKVTLVADHLDNARFMALDKNGTLYLSQPNEGEITMLKPQGDKYVVTGPFVEGLSKPHGMYYKGGVLWFTSDGKVSKATITDGVKKATDVTDILTGLPQGGHWWRSILVTGDHFYTSIGDRENIGDDEDNPRDQDREKIWRYNLDGSGKSLFSSGIRNTEKLWERPGSHRIFGCDQGSDWYGGPVGDKQGMQPITDFFPPEEFNEYVEGGFYGHPFIIANRIPRYEYSKRPDIIALAAKTIPPAWCMGPHWAADGWTFLDHSKMPASFDRDAVIALHGSWNRSTKAGYRIEQIMFDKDLGVPIGSQMLVGTLDAKGDVAARPVDVVQAPDGSLLFSDDQFNRIFRLTYVGK